MTSEADVAATIQTLQENAKRLGLSWDLTMATIQDGSSASNISAVFDADASTGNATQGLISIVGTLTPGARVYVLQIPPAGNYVIGMAPPIPERVLAHATSISLATLTTEIVLLTLPPVVFPAGGAFEIRAKAAESTTVAGFFLLLFRRGTTTAGAAIGEFEMPAVAGGVANCLDGVQRYVNNTGTDITEQISLTGINTAGTGTVIHASPFGPFWISVKYLGPASEFPGLNSI